MVVGMDPSILASLLTGFMGLIGSVLVALITLRGVRTQSDKAAALQDAATDKKIDLMNQEMKNSITNINLEVKQLRTEVERHNNLVDRMYKVEADISLIKQKQNENAKDIEEIKKCYPSV